MENNYTYEYPRPAVTVDIVLFDNAANPQKTLLIKRKNEPFKHCWAFPGGFMDMEETLLEAAKRELAEETGIKGLELCQIKAYDAVHRDSRARTIAIAFLGFANSYKTPICAADDAEDIGWFDINNLPSLAFDHKLMFDEMLLVVRQKKYL